MYGFNGPFLVARTTLIIDDNRIRARWPPRITFRDPFRGNCICRRDESRRVCDDILREKKRDLFSGMWKKCPDRAEGYLLYGRKTDCRADYLRVNKPIWANEFFGSDCESVVKDRSKKNQSSPFLRPLLKCRSLLARIFRNIFHLRKGCRACYRVACDTFYVKLFDRWKCCWRDTSREIRFTQGVSLSNPFFRYRYRPSYRPLVRIYVITTNDVMEHTSLLNNNYSRQCTN